MKIVSIAFGSHGDVLPALALGMALQDRGHQVQMVVGADFTEMVRKCGLEVAPNALNFKKMLDTDLGHKMFDSGNGPIMLTFTRTMKQLFTVHGPALVEQVYRACVEFGAEAVIGSYTSDIYALTAAEKLGIPYISTPVQPAPIATRSGAAALNSLLPNRESLINLGFHKVMVEPFVWRLMKGPVNDFRRDVLGLPLWNNRRLQQVMRRTPILTGYSKYVVPHPADWPDNIHTTGFWLLDSDIGYTLPDKLVKFLDDGEPPVFITFGTAIQKSDSPALTKLMIDAVAASGRRAVIQMNLADTGENALPDTIYHLTEYVSFADLFSRVAAVVHHAGAGTTSRVLLAGIPSVGVPHAGDQPFWANRVAALGASPRPISVAKLTADNLARAIRQATGDPAYAERSAALGAKIRTEDGVGTAVTLIDKYLSAG
jgi:sterol 3beta-glucosyltransferase